MKNQQMKKTTGYFRRPVYSLINVLVVLLFFSSCEYLDVVPDKVGTIENAFSNRHEAEKYLYTCYAYIPQHSDPGGNIALMGSDELWSYYPLTNYNNYNTWRIALGFQNVNNPYMNYWSHDGGASQGLYKGIRDCNIFLENISDLNKVGDISPTMRKRWLAEVKFLKAYYHFYLFRMYGPIVIVDKNLDISLSPEEIRSKRSPVDEVVAYIAGLLDEAAPELPIAILNKATELGRVTRPAALTLKAKLLVTAASPLFNGNPDYQNFKDKDGAQLINTEYVEAKWDSAIVACRKAVESCESIDAGIRLYEFNRVNLNLSAETTRELTIRNSVTEKWSDELIWGLSGRAAGGIQQTLMARIGQYPNNMWGAAEMINPTVDIAEIYYSKNGIPISEDKTWDFTNRYQVKKHIDNQPYNLISNYETVVLHFDREPRFYAHIAFDGSMWYQQNCKSGAIADIWTARGRSGQPQGKLGTFNYTTTGYWLKKLISWKYELSQNGHSTESYPWPEMRLADLYLLYAESLNEIDNEQNRELAIVYLNKVRERAGLPGIKEAWTNYSKNPNKYTTQAGLREIIQRERTIELMFEGHRFWDIRRWKTAYKEINNKRAVGWNIEGVNPSEYYQKRAHFTYRFIAPRDYLFPLKEYDLFVNPNLTQNPGW